MERDYQEYVKKCVKCQQHSHLQHLLAQALNPIQSMWPFAQWGFDLIGYFTLPSLGGHKFIITATEYFIEWVEAIPLVFTTSSKIIDFIDTHIVYRFGIPHRILIDNGMCFKNHHVKSLCKSYQIQHSFSMPYYPQGNGQAEATNKTIISILKKIVTKNHRDWHEHLLYALWAYHTSIRMPMGATPFSLVYGVEAIMPLELEISSLRVQLQGLIPDEDIR